MKNSKLLYYILTFIYILIHIAIGTIIIIVFIRLHKFLLLFFKSKGVFGAIISSVVAVLTMIILSLPWLYLSSKFSNFIDKFKK